MKTWITITILSIMFIITLEEEGCRQFTTKNECEDVHQNGLNCFYKTYSISAADGYSSYEVCVQIIDIDDCQFDPNNRKCLIKPGIEEPNLKACQLNLGLGSSTVTCELGPASCIHYYASKDKCLQLNDCGYDEKEDEYKRCFEIKTWLNDKDCSFEENKCISSSNKKTCYLFDDEDDKFCKSRNIQCSDLDEDSSSCPKADLQDRTKKCSYDASRSSGNKCFEVSIKEGCTYDNENKKCQGEYLSNGKICDFDFSANPVSCQKRNIQCGDFDGDETKCQNAKLPDKSKECSYNDQNKCIEKIKECIFNEEEPKSCVSSFPSKIKCELNGDKSGCNVKNFECSDFYNAQECNSHKPDNSLAKCVWTNECKEMTCETTSTENCGSFKPNDSGKQCALNSDKTKCEELSVKTGAENLKIFLSMFLLLIIF